MQIVQTAGFLIGPALAGFSIGFWGERVAFLADSATFFISAAFVITMTVPRTTRGQQVAGGQVSAVLGEMWEGVSYLFGNRTMVGVLLCLAVVQLGVGAMNVVWVPFMRRTFGLGPEGLGAVDTAQGIGMAIGGVTLGFMAARVKKTRLAGWSIIFIGGMIALVGLAPSFSLANLIPGINIDVEMTEMTVGQRLLHMPLLLLLYSMLLGIALVPAQSALVTMMQLAVPDLKRGRVGSALNALTTSAGLLSMAVAAAFADLIQLRAIYVTAGLLVSTGGLVGLFVLQEPEDPELDAMPDGAGERVKAFAD
jgi:MFS family permease